MNKKRLYTFNEFLFEQGADLGMPAMPGAPADPMAGAAPGNEKPLLFIFIDDKEQDGIFHKKFPDGSSQVEFPTYSVLPSEIDDWAKKNILSTDSSKLSDSVLDIRRKNLSKIIKGEKVNIADDDIPFIQKLKNAVSTDIFGKREPDTSVIFTKDGIPTTEEMKVTFIKYKK